MKDIIIVDIDHTLSDSAWRDELIGVASWDEYHQNNHQDEPIEEVVQLIKSVAFVEQRFFNYDVICVTARPEKWRQQTMDWLLKNDIMIDELLMRPDDNYMSAGELKVHLVKEHLRSLEKVAFVLDDNDKVRDAFRAEGVVVLQVFA
jgi:hypothetical protein